MSIVNNVRDAFSRVIETGTGIGYFIRDALFGAPPTTEQAPPYIPPFTGGQCEGVGYRIVVTRNYDFDGSPISEQNDTGVYAGAIRSVQLITVNPNRFDLRIVWNSGQSTSDFPNWLAGANVTNGSISAIDVSPVGGASDDCGDIPNPNPPVPIPDGGVPDSIPPNLVGDGIEIKEGLNPVAAGSALATALELVRNALNALDAIKALADAIEAIKDLLKNKDDKDDKKNVSIIQFNFGLIQRDGFLRLYPNDSLSKYEALYLDLQIFDIPRGYGRFFGAFSPNRFRFVELGYIAFVSPTFGVISTESLQYSRVSLGVPSGAIGFYYHLGLNGIIKANATGFYELIKEDESE